MVLEGIHGFDGLTLTPGMAAAGELAHPLGTTLRYWSRGLQYPPIRS